VAPPFEDAAEEPLKYDDDWGKDPGGVLIDAPAEEKLFIEPDPRRN
jgi:hypothetical protein